MWFLLLLTHFFFHIEPVSSLEKGSTILRNQHNKNNPCEGIVEVYYNGTRGYVGDKFWDDKTENVVCNMTLCGGRVASENEYRDMNQKIWLNELKCGGTEESLWDCPGWPAPGLSVYLKPTVKKVICSNQIKLKLSKHKCSGAVQYSINEKTGYFCNNNWGKKEANLLCESLGCGGAKQFEDPDWFTDDDFYRSDKMTLNCSGIDPVDHLWQCASRKPSTCTHPASVICEGYERVQLKGDGSNSCSGLLEIEEHGKWNPVKPEIQESRAETLCQQMHCGGLASFKNLTKSVQLNCTDQVEVVLTDKGKCYGEVRIIVNDRPKPVCASRWTTEDSKMVCEELKCGKMISQSTRSVGSGVMDFVKCSGNESSLWHCNAKHGSDIPCGTTPYVVCKDSVDVRLVDGPGRCAGRLEVFFEGGWRRVAKTDQTAYSDNVCLQLKCGTTRSVDVQKYSEGSGAFLNLNCKTKPTHISDCIQQDQNKDILKTDAGMKAVGITCDEHELVFLAGDKSCSGNVKIEKGGRDYSLSGSNNTWNEFSANTVCRQLHCGKVKKYTFKEKTATIWQKSYNCSSTKNSLFECDYSTSLPSDHNASVAYVECTGNIDITLSNGCWGAVHVSTAEVHGGLCADTWLEDWSKKLCSSLGCGEGTLSSLRQQTDNKIMFMSMHMMDDAAPLNQSNFVKKREDDSVRCTPAYVVCKGSIKPKFSQFRDKCSGNVEVNYEGKVLPVTEEALQVIETQNIICKELNCGTAVKSLPYFGTPSTADRVVSELRCSKDAASLAACDIKVKQRAEQTKLGGLRCSEWRTITLEVQDTCKGDVVVYSNKRRSVMSNDNWTRSLGQRICKDIECGDLVSNITATKTPGLPIWNKTFSCEEQSKSFWDCESKASAVPQKQTVQIQCKDEPKVTLSDTCSGVVKINNIEICAQNWMTEYAHMVCQEMNCGNAMAWEMKSKKPQSKPSNFHVSCDEHHYRLGQCKRFMGSCKDLVSITCIGNVTFNTSEKCGGVIQVNYRNKLENVCRNELTEELQNMLCRQINCGPKLNFNGERITLSKAPETSLYCPTDVNDVRYCVNPTSSCTDREPATVYCKGYEAVPPVEEEPTSPVPIVVGIGLVLVVVILIVIFLRYYLGKRAQKKRFPPGMLQTQDPEFESGEYEDVNKSDEMEDIRHGSFRPKAEFIRERDAQSTSSFPYDDIDEVAESQPLTPQSSIAAPPNDNNMHKGDLDQSDDGVNYEVDEAPDNYDDIDACPEVSQTSAEVHDGPRAIPEVSQTAAELHDGPRAIPESDATLPQGPLKENTEDYLVPGQDG